jgi:hypothetical protein
LNEALSSKDSSRFWKCWKAKFKNSKKTQVIDGTAESDQIACKFAEFFQATCVNNTSSKNDEYCRQFTANFASYTGSSGKSVLCVSDVEDCLRKLKFGKASGCNGISAEHLIFSHPILCVILTVLFNACIKHGYIPNGSANGLIVPLLKSSDLDATKLDSYRGITLSCVMSKLFEMCLLSLFGDFLVESSDLQFGFKPGLGCRDAVLTACLAVNYLSDRGSTATICALDLSKAFDRINHNCLLLKLMNRKAPKCLIALIANWYSRCTAVVRWSNCLSSLFKVQAGVRQGGVLSPFLFAIYMDVLIKCYKRVGMGCTFVVCS